MAEAVKYLQLQIPQGSELVHLSYIPPEVKIALSGLTLRVVGIQRDHLGYDQFYTLDADDLINALKITEQEKAAEWFGDFKESQQGDDNYIPEAQRNKIFIPAGAGTLVEGSNVE